MSSTGYHEPIEELSDAIRDMHRAWQQKQPDLFVMDVRNRLRNRRGPDIYASKRR